MRAFVHFHQNDWVHWLPLAEFAANNVISEVDGSVAFFANYGFNPRLGTEPSQPCPPNLSTTTRKELFRANAVINRFERIITQLKALAADSRRRYEDNANANREASPIYTVGQEVFVDTRHMKTNRPTKKLDDKWAGAFRITKVYLRAGAVELPEGIKIFPLYFTTLYYDLSP